MRRASSSVVVALAMALASCRTAAPPPVTEVPDPTTPPTAGTALPAAQADAARAAVGEAERGDFAASERDLGELPQGHPVRTLASLEIRYLRGEKVAAEALEFAAREPGYGSAWGFAVDAARREGDLRHAIEAARRADTLQPDAGWGRVAEESERAWVKGVLDQGDALLHGGDARLALERAREVLAVDAQAEG